MIRKLPLLLFLLSISVCNGQFNESAPWMQSINKNKKEAAKSRNSEATLLEISTAFNDYFKDKDITQKGNGYKPFKRWEHHWRNYVQKDGTLPSPNELWDLYDQKKSMTQNAESNWTSIGPWQTTQSRGLGRVNIFMIDPNNPKIYYVGAPAGGIWKSEDAGLHWIPLSDNIPQIGVSAIAIDPNNSQIIYIGTGDDDGGDCVGIGVMKSIDGGVTWKRTKSNTSMDYWVGEIYIHPQNSNVLWASSRRGFFKSTDAGENWEQILLGNQTANENFAVKDIKLKPGDPDVIYAVSYNSFWKSSNGGNSFTKILNGLPDKANKYAIAVSPTDPNLIYVLRAAEDSSFGGLYKSLDSGNSFTKTAQSSLDYWGPGAQSYYDMEITASPVDPDIVDIGVVTRYRSKDGGNSFVNIPTNTYIDFHYLGYFNNVLYEGNDGGIYQAIDNELNSPSSWKNLTPGLGISQIHKLTVVKSSDLLPKVFAGLQDNGAFSFNNWSWSNWSGGDAMNHAIHPTNENLIFSFNQYGERLSISEDGGLTRSRSKSKPPYDPTGYWYTPLQMDKDGVLWMAYDKGIYSLRPEQDYGLWFKSSADDFGSVITNMVMSPSHNDIMYISNIDSELFLTSSRGWNFNPVDPPENIGPYDFLRSIEVHNENPSIIYITYNTGDIFKRETGIWTSIKKNLENQPIWVIKHQAKSENNDLYIGTHLGVFYTNDNMDTWERFDNNLPNTAVKDLAINIENNTITAGTYGRGVWVSPLASSTALSVSLYDSVDTRIYPNPSNEQISIDLRDSQNINEIEIYDVTGRKVQSTKPINNLVDVKSLKSGWYIVVIKTDNGSVTKKLLVQH